MLKKGSWIEQPDGYLNKTPVWQFILVSILFGLWAIAQSLNDVLITQFKAVFNLSDFATAFVQTAYYGGYFLIAIPASIFIKKNSYKLGIIAGLSAYALGCFLFFPASRLVTYQVFLFAIFVIAVGLSFLETSSNTYSTLLGTKKTATVRLNISQSINAVGLLVGILLGKYFVFTNTNLKTKMAHMSNQAAQIYGTHQLARTLSPYKYLLIALLILIILFAFTKFPSGKAKTDKNKAQIKLTETFKYLFHNHRYWHGVVAQFLYMGVQTGIWSFTMRLALDMFPSFNERYVANFMLYSYGFFIVSRFLGSYLLSRFSETKVLITFTLLCTLDILYATFIPNISAIYAAVLASLFMGPCYPTIFARSLETVKDKRHTETASAFLVMAIVGGAILPTLQGLLSDHTNMQFSFILLVIEMFLVFIYFLSEKKYDKNYR